MFYRDLREFTVLDKTKMFTKVYHFKLTAYSENKNNKKALRSYMTNAINWPMLTDQLNVVIERTRQICFGHVAPKSKSYIIYVLVSSFSCDDGDRTITANRISISVTVWPQGWVE